MNIEGRIPYRLLPGNHGPAFRWLYTGPHRFTEPFFDETIARCLSLPENDPRQLPVTTAEQLLSAASAAAAPEPAGFIFHISRCGSTLLSQLLSLDERCIVLSEVPLLDAILRLPENGKGPSPEMLFRAVLKLLGRRRTGKEQFLFLKTDSWHTLFYDRLRAWYPDAPSVLLYRAPQEVCRSHERQKGMHAVPGLLDPEWFGLQPAEAMHMQQPDYLAKVLETYFRHYLRIAANDPLASLMSYHDGAAAMMKQLAGHFRIVFSETAKEAMERRMVHHSKDAGKVFVEENANGLIAFERPVLDELFRRLEERRVSGSL